MFVLSVSQVLRNPSWLTTLFQSDCSYAVRKLFRKRRVLVVLYRRSDSSLSLFVSGWCVGFTKIQPTQRRCLLFGDDTLTEWIYRCRCSESSRVESTDDWLFRQKIIPNQLILNHHVCIDLIRYSGHLLSVWSPYNESKSIPLISRSNWILQCRSDSSPLIIDPIRSMIALMIDAIPWSLAGDNTEIKYPSKTLWSAAINHSLSTMRQWPCSFVVFVWVRLCRSYVGNMTYYW